MKVSSRMLSLFLTCYFTCLINPSFTFAAEPELQVKPVQAGEINIIQAFSLWIDPSDNWEINIFGPTGLLHRHADGEWVEQVQPITGEQGEDPLTLEWQIGFNPGWSAPGIKQLPTSIEMSGAEGLLRLEHDGLWLMPLNSDSFSVSLNGESVSLPNYEWYHTSDRVNIYHKGQLVSGIAPQAAGHKAVSPTNVNNEARIRWITPDLVLEAGEKADVVLAVEGPTAAGELIIKEHEYIDIDFAWFLHGVQVQSVKEPGQLRMQLPDLPPGEHQLHGSLQALLPGSEGEIEISAAWKGGYANLGVTVQRAWFDQPAKVVIQAMQEDAPASHAVFLLPNGELKATNTEGSLTVHLPPGLHVLYCLEDMHNPIWVRAQANTVTHVDVSLGNSSTVPHSYVVPTVSVGQENSWRVAARLGEWHFTIAEDESEFAGEAGPLRLAIHNGRLSVKNGLSPDEAYRDGGWFWRPSHDGWAGNFASDGLTLSVSVPASSQSQPTGSLSLFGENWRLSLKPQAARISYVRPNGAIAIVLLEDQPRLELRAQNFFFQLGQFRLRLKWSPEREYYWKLSLDPERIHLELDRSPWTAFAEYSADDSWRTGLRITRPQRYEAFQFSTGLALLASDGAILSELTCGCTWNLSDQIRWFVLGQLQCNNLQSLSGQYELGVHVTPIPYVSCVVSCSSQGEWKWQIGASLPLIGRTEKDDTE